MLTEGQMLAGRYRVGRRLKEGGMGAVYEGFDTVLNAPVAIKENCVEDAAMREAFAREAQLLANLQHASLPRCSNLLEEGGCQFIVMEFIEGDDLAAVMTQRRTWLPNETVADLAWQLLDLLEYLHGESVLHRDIKPANLKLRGGRAYLLDFGLAYGRSGEMETVDAGKFNWKYRSKRYSPLEQSKCQRTSPASDCYSFAATLYYLLTNVQPADASERFESVSRGMRDPLEDVRVYNPSADEHMSRAVMRALSLGADERPQTAEEMRELMFPESGAGADDAGGRPFLTARLLSEIVGLSVLACVLFFVLRQSRQPQPPPPEIVIEQEGRPTPAPVAPTPTPTPSPAEVAARLAKAVELARHGGNNKEAWSLLEQALDLDEKNLYLHFLLGDMLWEAIVDNGESERIPEVLAEADLILGHLRTPRSAQETVARAWANFAKASLGPQGAGRGLLDLVIADANEVLTKHDPDSVEALMLHASATCLKAEQRFDERTAREVLKDYDRAIARAPEYAQARANHAAVHFALWRLVKGPARDEHLARARDGYEKAVSLLPRPAYRKYLGDVYFELKEFEKARASFGAAAESDPTYFLAHVGLGDVLLRLGRAADAEASYLEANRLNKSSDKWRLYVLRKLAAVYNDLKQHDRAAETSRQALKLAPDDPAAKRELERASAARPATGSG